MPQILFHDITELIPHDARGWSFDPKILPAFPDDYHNIHIVSLEPGAVRGNHYHENTREWMFAFGGEYVIRWKSEGKVEEKTIPAGRLIVAEIPPSVTHAIGNFHHEIIYCWIYQKRDNESAENDSFRDVILT